VPGDAAASADTDEELPHAPEALAPGKAAATGANLR
jgi:hypothetical protein